MKPHTRTLVGVVICVALLFSVLITVQQYTGWVPAVEAEAGRIYEILIFQKSASDRWSGFFGVVTRLPGFTSTQSTTADAGEIVQFNAIFDCFLLESQSVLFVAEVPQSSLDFSQASAPPLSWINEQINGSDARDGANATYFTTIDLTIGGNVVTDLPLGYTRVFNTLISANFPTGVVNISGNIVFFGIVDGIKTNYKNEQSNYQVLVANDEDDTTFYLFPDPTTQCIAGIGDVAAGFADGYTLDQNGDILSDVAVYLSSSVNITNASGYFNMTVGVGDYQIVGIKAGYENYVNNITILVGNYTRHNITMVPLSTETTASQNVTLTGTVIDNVTKLAVANATASIAGQTDLTDGNGSYSLTAQTGTHNFLTIHPEYLVHYEELTLVNGSNLVNNVSLIPRNGTLRGYVFESIYNLPLVGINLTLGGRVVNTNSTGQYIINIRSGDYNVVAAHPDYDPTFVEQTILPGTTSYLNITLDPLFGTVEGYVYLNGTNSTIANATVALAGRITTTNATGQYNLTVLAGNRTIGAFKEGYGSFASNISVVGNIITSFNISLPLQLGPVDSTNITIENGTVAGVVQSESLVAIENATVVLAGSRVSTPSNGSYALDAAAGFHNIMAVATGYELFVLEVNVTANRTTLLDINLTAETPAAVGPGVGPGVGVGEGPGVDIGPGEADEQPIVPQIENPLELVEFEILPDRILKKLREGTFTDVPLVIRNFQKQRIRVTFNVVGEVAPLVELEKTDLLVDAEGENGFRVLLLGRYPPGVYSGTLQIRGDVEKDIPIDLLIYSKDKLPIEVLLMKLTTSRSRVAQGGKFSYKIDLQNLLREEEYRVFLFYSMFNLDTNETFFIEDRDTLELKTSESLIKRYLVGTDIPLGNYELVVDAQYLNFTTQKRSYVKITLPLAQYKVFGVIPVWLLSTILGTLTILTAGILWYLHYRKKRKRYQIAVDYNAFPNPGPRSAYVGLFAETNKPVYFDLDLFQVHSLCAGSTGSGKSISAQVMVEEALMHGSAVIVFDPTAQWTGYLRKCTDPHFLGLYPRFSMKKSDARPFNGNVRQILDAREKLDIAKYINPGEITVFAINRLQPEDIDILVTNTIQSVFKADLPESKTLRLIIIFEEVHRLLPKFGGSGSGFRQIERGAREFRKWGVGLLLISQVLGDFAGEIKANINTEIQMRTRHEGDMKRIIDQYGEAALKSVVKSQIGTGMVQNSSYNHGRPFFVSFRPLLHNTARLPEKELGEYNKFNDLIDDIEYQMAQLKDEGQDTFDLTLELKLAKDKLKSGNFNMVNIYLEGLGPRLEEMWKKLGKKPKKKERELVSQDDLQEGMKEAIKAREQAEKEDKAKAEEGKEETKGDEKKEDAPPTEKKEEPASKEEKKTESEEKGEEKSAPKEKETSPPPSPPAGGTPAEKAPAATQENPADHAKELIAQAKTSIENKDKKAAKQFYAELQTLYKSLPAAEKKSIMQQILALRKSLTG